MLGNDGQGEVTCAMINQLVMLFHYTMKLLNSSDFSEGLIKLLIVGLSRMPCFLSCCFLTLDDQSPCLETWITHDTCENATSCGSCKVLGSGASGSDGATVERVWDLSKFLHVSTAGVAVRHWLGALAEVMSAVGLCEKLGDEKLLDAVTGLSGSGPAYVWLAMQGEVRCC